MKLCSSDNHYTTAPLPFEEVTLSDEEIKAAFFSLKGNESLAFDEINYVIVKENFNSLLVPLK